MSDTVIGLGTAESLQQLKEYLDSVRDGDSVLQYFKHDHLPQPLRQVAKPFADLAHIVALLPVCAQSARALEKLLEAKDCAVRAALSKSGTHQNMGTDNVESA